MEMAFDNSPVVSEIPLNNFKEAPVAKIIVVKKLDFASELCVVLTRRSKKVSRFLGVSDDVQILFVESMQLDHEDFPEVEAGKPLLVSELEGQHGYLFFFDPLGDPQRSALTVLREQTPHKTLLELILNESGILEDEPSVALVADIALHNTGRDGLMKMKLSQQLLADADELSYLNTTNTSRDIGVYMSMLESSYATTEEAGRMGFRIVNRLLNAAKNLYNAGGSNISLRDSFVVLPELTGLDAKERESVDLVFKHHDDLFKAGKARLENGDVNPQKYDATPVRCNGVLMTPTFELKDGGEYRGPIILRSIENDPREVTAKVLTKVMRSVIADECEDTRLHNAPRVIVSFQGPGKVFIQMDAAQKRLIKGTPFAAQLRIAEVNARTDLDAETKRSLLNNMALLSETGAPEYGNGKRSFVILTPSLLQLGNTFDPSNAALPLTDTEILQALVDVIEASRTEVLPENKHSSV